ncbi:MAG TPA: hypothetical protein VK507_07500 [Iamia sp.]|nr:hypothetical protein [Iamia sp.]
MSDARASKPTGAADVRNGPPVLVLVLAGLCVVTSAALVPLDDLGTHVLGYVAASVLAIVLVGLFRRFDLTRRLAPGYRARPGVGRLVTVLLLAAFAVAAVHVWAIATELAS